MSSELRDIISGALDELAPLEEDNLVESADLEVGDDEIEDDGTDDFDGVDDNDEEADDESDDSDPELDATYQVKVDGETVDVTLKEALAGYQRQADYTRKAQALAAEREAFQVEVQEVSGVLENVQLLDEAWESNPIGVIANFTMSTGNPTQAVALLIKELATAGELDRQFMEMFGITDEVRDEWARESEVTQLKQKVSKTETEQKVRLEQAEMEAAVQKAIVEFDRQIDNIIESEGLDMSAKERIAFRKELAAYARSNDLTNLEAAYKALKYEESKAKRAIAVKTAERAKQKKTTGAVARSSSAGAGTPVSSETDLRSIIMASMKEQGL